MTRVWENKSVCILHLPFGGAIQVQVHSVTHDEEYHIRTYDRSGSRVYAGVLDRENNMFNNGRLLGRLVSIG